MKIRNIGSNQTEVELNGNTTILVSYQTPVAAWIDGRFYRTAEKWSVTTSKHVTRWLDGRGAEVKPQEWFDKLTA